MADTKTDIEDMIQATPAAAPDVAAKPGYMATGDDEPDTEVQEEESSDDQESTGESEPESKTESERSGFDDNTRRRMRSLGVSAEDSKLFTKDGLHEYLDRLEAQYAYQQQQQATVRHQA